VVATWWRTGWDAALYPYVPAHVTRPKEALRLFFVALPEKGFFGVPRDRRLVAVPLFELHDNPSRYGPLLAALPAMLSRFRVNLVAAAGGGVAAAAAVAPPVSGGVGGAEAFDPYAS
jgi:cleavage and polyadenylation specificity factor subunit 5